MKRAISKSKSVSHTADIGVSLFRIAARFCGGKDRNNISGVHVSRHPKGGVVLVGTDGHRMLVIHDRHGKCSRPFTIDAKEGAVLARKHDRSGEDQETRWRVSTKAAKGWQRVPLVDGAFPDWVSIPIAVARSRGGAVPALNARYVADFMRAAVDLQKHIATHPRIVWASGRKPSEPILIKFPSAPHAFGVVMPMIGGGTSELPVFMRTMMPLPRAKKT